MRIRQLHDWNVTPREAIRIQEELRARVRVEPLRSEIRTVAGVDIAWERHERGVYSGYAGVVVFSFPALREIERVWVAARTAFPYVPGLLSFREIPLLLPAFERLQAEPDVIFVDGQGLAHPRRFGMASHLGLVLDRPTIGCAKSRLIGLYREPGLRRGCHTRLLDKGEIVGTALRTRDGVAPIFVSVGHCIDLPSAIRLTLRCCEGFRIPKPTRRAHIFVGELFRKRLKDPEYHQTSGTNR